MGAACCTHESSVRPPLLSDWRRCLLPLPQVPKQVVLNNKLVQWAGTPWLPCSSPCGSGIQYREVFCSMTSTFDPATNTTLTSQANASKANRIDESLCVGQVKPSSSQYCNKFHCEKTCRKDADRTACTLYETDIRAGAESSLVRQQACEQAGCCFVLEPEMAKRSQEPPPPSPSPPLTRPIPSIARVDDAPSPNHPETIAS